MPIILCGADEAGRGAILGPLVVSMVGVKSSSVRRLTDIGVRDSKLLSEKRRKRLYDDIVSIANAVKVRCITPAEINDAMASDISINEVEAKAFSEIFNDIDGDVSLVYLDSPDVIPERFGVRFSMYSTRPTRVIGVKGGREKGIKYTRIISEHKADARYPVVSAASIIAKVTRDEEIAKLQRRLRLKIGSGYPSDDLTVKTIRNNLKNEALGEHIRLRWSTVDRIKQTSLLEFA
ncbi:MAG: ribonuclease HII [Candidatus Micrarchaeota archaeon]|nr:ribonuclease HII [Candidatus Micrarchaeota archaeon]